MKERDKEDKLLLRKRLREKRIKEKMKLRKGAEDSSGSDREDSAGSDRETNDKRNKRSKIYFDDDNEDGEKENKHELGVKSESISLAEQEALALKLLSSMHE